MSEFLHASVAFFPGMLDLSLSLDTGYCENWCCPVAGTGTRAAAAAAAGATTRGTCLAGGAREDGTRQRAYLVSMAVTVLKG